MKKIIDWARKNAHITHDAPDLMVGKFNNKKFRIFVIEGWAGINFANSWLNVKTCYNLKEFKKALSQEGVNS